MYLQTLGTISDHLMRRGFSRIDSFSYVLTSRGSHLGYTITLSASSKTELISGRFGAHECSVQDFVLRMLLRYEDDGYRHIFSDMRLSILTWPIAWRLEDSESTSWNFPADFLQGADQNKLEMLFSGVFEVFAKMDSLSTFYDFLCSNSIGTEWKRSNCAVRVATLVGLGVSLGYSVQKIESDALKNEVVGMRTSVKKYLTYAIADALNECPSGGAHK